MGHVDRFDLNKLIKEYNISIFIETGTGIGVSLEYALKFPFKKFYSIEIIEELFNVAKNKYGGDNCIILNKTSKEGLNQILTELGDNKNVMFWLDAHFPGADFQLSSYSSTKDNELRIPLESELREIKRVRDTTNDIFIVDDLRIYEDGNFSGGNWVDRRTLGGNGIGFIYELFGDTHEISRDYRDQGYIQLLPKNG